MYYNAYTYDMHATIRNLDEAIYRRLKARAAATGRTVGELMNEAMRVYLDRPSRWERRASLGDWRPDAYPSGNEKLSESIDRVVYGID